MENQFLFPIDMDNKRACGKFCVVLDYSRGKMEERDHGTGTGCLYFSGHGVNNFESVVVLWVLACDPADTCRVNYVIWETVGFNEDSIVL